MVTSWLDWYLAKRAALVIGAGVECNKVKPFLAEDSLLVHRAPPIKIAGVVLDVEEACLSEEIRSRAAAESMIEGRGLDTGEKQVQCLRQKWKILQDLNSEWRVTFNMFQMHVGENGEDAYRSATLNCLPSEEQQEISPGESLVQLQALQSSKLFEYIGPGLQSKSRDIIKWVSAIKDMRQPDFGSETSKFISDVQFAMGFFAFEEMETKEEGKKTLRKDAAVKEWMAKLTKEVEAGNRSSQASIVRKIKSMSFVLPSDLKMQFHTMYKEISTPVKKRAASCSESANSKLAKLYSND